ncbi:hypothetical protein PVK06_012493 [Gossypium arboreum]|uniref:DUF4283 domain-containing protein n=1 Tax=Gossypium arboreum TaxID=29729 RepID=A0ABR0QBK4_GOSAR|nr:hypothetical protein PVK06_012493 [Gossypium arboreum]
MMEMQHEEDLELDDRDAKNEIIDGIPNSTFSDQIQLPRPPEGMYTKSLLRFIGGAIRLVAKIDRNIENNTRDQLVRLAVYVELGKLLVSKAKIDGRIQWVEYKSLPSVCFEYGRWGYTPENCIHKQRQENLLEAEENSKSNQVLLLDKNSPFSITLFFPSVQALALSSKPSLSAVSDRGVSVGRILCR